MKKKIAALFCAASIVCAIFPLSVSAAGNLEGVDYTRITSGTGYQVKLTLGDLEFWGDLSRGTNLSVDEQDKIIRQVMLDQKVTSGMLINAPSIIAQAETIEGFSMKDAIDAILKLTGASDLLALYDIVMDNHKPKTASETAKDAALDWAKDQGEEAVEEALTKGGKVALRGGGKFALKVFFLLPDITEIGLDALTKYENIQATVALAIEKKTMLERFYDECNKRIAEASGDGGEWKISFAGPRGQGVTAVHNFNMWGIGGLMSEWTLTGELVRQVTGAGDNYGGTYQGALTLTIEGVDMKTSFDERFKDNDTVIVREKPLMGAFSIKEFVDDYKETTLKRTVSGSFTVYIQEGSGEIKPTVLGSLTSDSDKTEFFFEHTITGEGKNPAGDKILRTYKYTSSELASYTAVFEGWQINTLLAVVPPRRGDLPFENNGETDIVKLDIGTVWKPLDSEPSLTLYLK